MRQKKLDDPTLFPVRAAARSLGIHHSTLEYRIKTGMVAVVYHNGRRYVRVSSENETPTLDIIGQGWTKTKIVRTIRDMVYAGEAPTVTNAERLYPGICQAACRPDYFGSWQAAVLCATKD